MEKKITNIVKKFVETHDTVTKDGLYEAVKNETGLVGNDFEKYKTLIKAKGNHFINDRNNKIREKDVKKSEDEDEDVKKSEDEDEDAKKARLLELRREAKKAEA